MVTIFPVTVQAAGGDYPDVSLALSGEARNLVTADEVCQIEVDSSGFAGGKLVDKFTISGFTSDSTRYVHLTAQSGQECDGSVINGALIESSNYGAVCTISQIYTRVSRLNFRCASGYHSSLVLINYGYQAIIDGCLLISNGATIGDPLLFLGAHNSVVYRTLVISESTSTSFNAVKFANPVHDCQLINCTIHGGILLEGSTTNTVLKNNVAPRSGADTTWTVNGSITSSTNNAAMDGSSNTPPGSLPLTVDLIDGIDLNDIAGTWDFSINPGSALYHAGDNSTLSVVPYDIAGNPYDATNPSIGAFEYINAGLIITPSGIASAEAFGTPTLNPGAVTIDAAGIATQETIGSHTVSPGPLTLTPAGIQTAESIGNQTIVPGAAQINPTGIASQEAIGNQTVAPGLVSIDANGIASVEAFGNPALTLGGVNLFATSIPSGEAIGSPVIVPGAVVLSLSGIPSAEAIGAAQVIAAGTGIYPSGIASAEAFGSQNVQPGAVTISPGSILSAEVFGIASLSVGGTQVNASGIASAEAFGLATLLQNPVINTQGIESAESVGALTVIPGPCSIDAIGIPSAEGFGLATLQPGSIVIIPNGIASLEAIGDAVVIQGAAVITPAGIPSAEAIGQITIIGGTEIIGWLEWRINLADSLLFETRVNGHVH